MGDMRAPFRFLRAAAVTTAMFSLAAGAHVLGGGVLPDPALAAGILALTLVPVMALTGVKVSAPAMVGLLGSSQLVLHAAFTALSVPAHFRPVHAGHVHGTAEVILAAPVLAQSHAAAAPSLPMALAHAAATLATALLLARGEEVLWALAAWLRPLTTLPAAVAIHPLPRIPVPVAVPVPSRWRNLRLPALRGPPAPAAS